MNNSGGTYELGERVIAAFHQENTGATYKRQHYIAALAFDALVAAAEKPVQLCQFKNKYGWCKLEDGHGGQHTVIFLGKDDEWEE